MIAYLQRAEQYPQVVNRVPYVFPRLVKHCSPTIIRLQMSSKRPYTANNIKPTAILELPVRNETTVWAEASICILLTSFGFRFLIGSVGLQCAQ